MSERNDSYDVKVDWPTVVPLGDTLAIRAGDGFDDRWAKAFDVVLDDHQHRTSHPEWGKIDFDYASNQEETRFVLYVRSIRQEAKATELRRTLDDLVKTANTVAHVGPHVYELARELREPPATGPRQSSPPPAEPVAEDSEAPE
jgi:hypothetical protein